MKLPQCFLNVCLLFLAITANAQYFNVIEETKDYILKECDSAYYYTHGIEPKDDFIIDTTKIKKVNGVLKLPLDNGKELIFRDTIVDKNPDLFRNHYKGEDQKNGYYLMGQYYSNEHYELYLIDKKNGTKEHIENAPNYSPSSIYFVYCLHFESLSAVEIIIKNINSKKWFNLKLDYYIGNCWNSTNQFKWLSDNIFVFNTEFSINKEGRIIGSKKYYVVKIKQ